MEFVLKLKVWRGLATGDWFCCLTEGPYNGVVIMARVLWAKTVGAGNNEGRLCVRVLEIWQVLAGA